MRKLEANDCLAVYMSVMKMMTALFARADVSILFIQLLLPLQHLTEKLVFSLSEKIVYPVFIIYNNDLNYFQCFYKIHGDYEFKVCPWSRVIQSNRWYSDQYYLGDWDNVDQIATDGDTMDFTGGDGPCPNGRYRSARVNYTCGTATRLVSCSEPSMCYYVFEMEVNCNPSSAGFARSAARQTDFMPLMSNTTVV